TELSYYALSGEAATTINLPSTLKRINESAIASCSNATVNLPDSLEYIGKSAFAGTPVGETVHMPENLTTSATRPLPPMSTTPTIPPSTGSGRRRST
ncbi:MAG: leucine-rich repeat protein, partial [Oscillospiraceae bacterium]